MLVLINPQPIPATVVLGNLSQSYDGTAKSVTVTTAPANLAASVTYDGSASAPTNAGSYTTVGTITDPSYYGATTNTLVIAPTAATVTLGNLSQIYDGTTKPVSVTTAPSNLAVSVTYNGSASVPINGGRYNVIAVVTEANYRGTNSATGQITPKALSVTPPAIAAKGYDATATAGVVTVGALSGWVGNEIVSATGAAADYASANVGTYSGVNIIYTLHDGTGGGWAANYSLVNGTATGQITPRALSVTGIRASDKVYDGTTNATLILTQAALAGNLDGTNVVLRTTNATGAFADPSVGTNQTVWVSGLTLSGSSTNNYAFTQPTTNATITTRPLNITANADSKLYGTAKPYGPGQTAFSTGAGELVTGDTVTSVTLACLDGGPVTAVVGSYHIIPSAAVGTGLDNYAISYHDGTMVVNQAVATVTLGNLSQTYNGSVRTASASTIPAGLSLDITYNGSAGTPVNVGSYTVVALINHHDYKGGTTNTLVVNPAAATVTLGNLSQTYNGSVRAAAVSTIPAGLSLNVTYNGSATAPVNAGNYTVVAQLNSPNYPGGATNTLVVGRASQTINLALAVTNSIPLNQITNPIAVLATASSGLPVTLRLGANSAAVLTETNTLVAIQAAGTITILANQGGNNNYQAAAEEVLTLEVGLVPQTITFAPIPDVAATHGPIALNATASSGLAVLYSVVSGPATISGHQLTLTGAGLVIVAADQPGNASYNAAETVKQRFNATLASQAITFGSLPPRNYGNGSYGNATFTLSATASSGLPVSYTSSDSAVASVSGSTVTITGAGTAILTASQAGNAYYEAAANVSQSLVVNPVAATVALGNLIQRYTATARSVTATTAPAGLAVSVTYDGWPTAPTNAGSYTVVATITAANYSGRATNTLVISAPLATVTLGNLSQTYNGAARTVSVSTVPADLSLAVTYNGSATAPTNVGSYTVVARVTSPNYTGGATNVLVVGKAFQTIDLQLEVTNSIRLNEFTNPIPVMATASSGLLVTLTLGTNSAAVLTETNTLVSIKAIGTITILANQAGNDNYQAAAEEEVTLDVTLAPQTITFEPVPDVPATHGPIDLNATASSGLEVSYSVVSGPATISNNVVMPTGSGLVTVAANQPGSTNQIVSIFAKGGGLGYNPAPPVFQSFYVTLASQAITFGPLSARAYGSGSFALSATASSGLPVSYVSSDPGVATISGSTVTLVSAGAATLTASQAGDGVYAAATNVSQVLTITPGAATVALDNLIQGYNGTARSVIATPTPAGLAVSVTYDGWPTAPTNAGRYSVVATIADPNYQGSNSATSRITPKALTVTAPSIAARSYDATATAGAVSVGALAGFVGSEYVTATGAAADYPSANVGTYGGVEISYTLHDGTGGGLAGNYSLANGTATGQITPRALTVAGILASDKVYDGRTNATLILTQAALAGNLDGTNVVLSTANVAGAFADPHVGINKPVQVAGLTLSGSATNNYTFSQPTTSATITGKRLTITANADAKTYGEVKVYGPNRMEFGTDAGDLVSGDDVTSVTLACADGGPATAVVGSYAIIPSAAVGVGVENYIIRYHAGVLTVDARRLNLKVQKDSKTYGAAKRYGPGQTAFSPGAGELVNGDRVSSVTLACLDGGPASAVVGSYHIISSAAVGTGLANYAIHYYDGVLMVNPKPLTITANADSKTYGQTKTYGSGQTAFSPGAGELVNGDSVTSVTLACLDGGPATAAAGSYDIIASAAVGSGLGNYSVSCHAGTLRVLGANSVMTLVSSANPSVNGSNVTFTAMVTPVAPATTTPGGSVQFYLNGSVSGSPVPLSGGVAGIIAAFYKIGTNLVAAIYLPAGNYVGSEASLEQLVQATPQAPITAGIKNNGNGTVTVSFSGTPNAAYVVQASDRLVVPRWQNVSTNVAGADGRWTFESIMGRDAQRFYRSVRP